VYSKTYATALIVCNGFNVRRATYVHTNVYTFNHSFKQNHTYKLNAPFQYVWSHVPNRQYMRMSFIFCCFPRCSCMFPIVSILECLIYFVVFHVAHASAVIIYLFLTLENDRYTVPAFSLALPFM
jgi:hypothetical protein